MCQRQILSSKNLRTDISSPFSSVYTHSSSGLEYPTPASCGLLKSVIIGSTVTEIGVGVLPIVPSRRGSKTHLLFPGLKWFGLITAPPPPTKTKKILGCQRHRLPFSAYEVGELVLDLRTEGVMGLTRPRLPTRPSARER